MFCRIQYYASDQQTLYKCLAVVSILPIYLIKDGFKGTKRYTAPFNIFLYSRANVYIAIYHENIINLIGNCYTVAYKCLD